MRIVGRRGRRERAWANDGNPGRGGRRPANATVVAAHPAIRGNGGRDGAGRLGNHVAPHTTACLARCRALYAPSTSQRPAPGDTEWTRHRDHPHGCTLVYTARPSPASTPQLYLRPADQLDATPLRGAENAVSPFVSPDGPRIGFVESTISPTFARIKKVSILGGPAIVVAQLPDLPIAGATWLTDGTIVVGTTRGLKKIAPTGAVTDVTTSDPSAGERAHAWPSAVSGSTMVLFAITPVGAARPKIAVVDGLERSDGQTAD